METYRLETPHISLIASILESKLTIKATFIDIPLTTKSLTNLIPLLETKLPTIFKNKCYNDGHLSFREEVTATEIGHLFEHILMEYFCIEHECCSTLPIRIKGLTTWDWYTNPIGTFTIELTSNEISMNTFIRSLNQTIAFMDLLFAPAITPQPNLLPVTLTENISPALAIASSQN